MPAGHEGVFTDCMERIVPKAKPSDPEAFCAWYHHKETGSWPAEKRALTISERAIAKAEFDVWDADQKAEKAESIEGYHVLKAEAPKRYTLGVVYEPDVVDLQGDFADAETIETAAHTFLAGLQQKALEADAAVEVMRCVLDQEPDALYEYAVDAVIAEELEKAVKGAGDQHRDWDPSIGTVVESYLAPADCTVNGEAVRKGAWLLGVVWSPEQFAKIERGERTGLSLGGRATRVPAYA